MFLAMFGQSSSLDLTEIRLKMKRVNRYSNGSVAITELRALFERKLNVFPKYFFQGKVELMPSYCQAVNKFTPLIRSAISMVAMIAIIATLPIHTELVSSAKFEFQLGILGSLLTESHLSRSYFGIFQPTLVHLASSTISDKDASSIC